MPNWSEILRRPPAQKRFPTVGELVTGTIGADADPRPFYRNENARKLAEDALSTGMPADTSMSVVLGTEDELSGRWQGGSFTDMPGWAQKQPGAAEALAYHPEFLGPLSYSEGFQGFGSMFAEDRRRMANDPNTRRAEAQARALRISLPPRGQRF